MVSLIFLINECIESMAVEIVILSNVMDTNVARRNGLHDNDNRSLGMEKVETYVRFANDCDYYGRIQIDPDNLKNPQIFDENTSSI